MTNLEIEKIKKLDIVSAKRVNMINQQSLYYEMYGPDNLS